MLHAGAPSYQTPTMMILMLAVAVVGVGLAHAAVGRLRQRMHERELMYGAGGKQVEDAAAQGRLGRLHLEAEQTERNLRAIVAELMELRDAGSVTREDRARFAGGMSLGVKQCRDIVNGAVEACGTRAYANDNPIQRILRDTNVLASHMIFGLDQRMEDHGRACLGLDIRSPML
jgi:alkylation response protein AidB-like acyl-CoA dehydrogenase